MSHPEQLCVNPEFLVQYLRTFFEKIKTLSEKELYLAAWGSEIDASKEAKGINGQVNFRPLFVSAARMITEINQQLPPDDARSNHYARWRYACWKSYELREQTPIRGRNAPAVEGQQVEISGSQPWQAGSQST